MQVLLWFPSHNIKGWVSEHVFLFIENSFLLLEGSLFMCGLVCLDTHLLRELQTPSALE